MSQHQFRYAAVAAALIALILLQPVFRLGPAAFVVDPLRVDLIWQSTTGGLSVWEMEDVIRRGAVGLAPDQVADAQWKIVGVGTSTPTIRTTSSGTIKATAASPCGS